MSAAGYPFQMVGGVPVVSTPAEIDATTADELRAILLEWQSRGHATIVVNMTSTQYCDSAGLRELVWAHKRAVSDGGGLRLVTPAEGAMLRTFTIAGLDGVIPRFATLRQALAELPAVAVRPLRRPAPEPAAAPASAPARLRDLDSHVTQGRDCEQCGTGFVPQREHARFCSAECRAAWNGEHLGDPAVEASALTWSLAAMSEATARLPAVRIWDLPQAFAAIGEAVWWITMVDATLMRHHQGVYYAVMAAHAPAERRLIEETMAGFRFVRNWSSREAGISDVIATSAGGRRVTRWTWKPVQEPALPWLPPRAQAWELTRYRGYQARLAGQTLGTTFGRAAAFLTLAGAEASSPQAPAG